MSINQDKKDALNKGPDKIDELKSELYSRKTKVIKQERKKIKKRKIAFENAWGKKNAQNDLENQDLYNFKKKGPSIFSIIFILAFLFFIGATLFAGFLFLSNTNEVKSEINISIIGPNSIKSGEPLEFIVNLENPTTLDYREIDFTVTYPESTIDNEEKNFIKRKTIRYPEDLLSGGKISQKFSAILSGIEDEKKEIELSVSYKAGDFSNLLFLNRIYDIEIDSSPAIIKMEYPAEVLSKKNFTFDVNILSNSNEVLRDLIIVGNYPSSFIVSETNPKAVFSQESQEIFKIAKLDPGETKTIKVSGSLVGQNNEEKFFSFDLGDSVPFRNELRTLFSRIEKEISIKRPDIDLFVDTSFDDTNDITVVPAGEKVVFEMGLANNLTSLISDLKITASFQDNLIKKREVSVSKGFYNSNKDKIVWDKNTDKFLRSLSSDASLKESFAFKMKSIDDIAGYFKDPKMKIDFTVEGINFTNENSSGYISEKFQKIIKIPTKVSFETDILYQNGPFKNSGNIEPKVGEATTYTVAWKIYNSSSDITDVEVVAKLPPYIRYIDNVFPKNAYVSFNEDKREVTLRFNKIDAFIGYRTDPKTVYFQIELIPTAPQIGKTPIVVKEKELKAKDNFTGQEIYVKVEGKDTRLRNDSVKGSDVGVVTE